MTEDEREIRRLVQRVDPASVVAPLEAQELVRLIDEAVRADPVRRSARRTRAPVRQKVRLRSGVIAAGSAGALAIAVVAAIMLGGGSERGVTELSQPAAGGPAAACSPVSPQRLAAADIAFEGRVTSISRRAVTLRVTRRFAGDVADAVQLPQATTGGDPAGPVAFEPGRTYLLAVIGGSVLTCGASGVQTSQLLDLYDQAFAPGR